MFRISLVKLLISSIMSALFSTLLRGWICKTQSLQIQKFWRSNMDKFITRFIDTLLTSAEKRRIDKVAKRIAQDDVYDMYLAQRVVAHSGVNPAKVGSIQLHVDGPMVVEEVKPNDQVR